MVRLKLWGRVLLNIAIVFSFIFNLIFLIVIIVLVINIFDIKRGLLQPLVSNLYSSFVGLDQATILTTIHVQDTVPVKLTIPLQTQTIVTLTSDVPVHANASFSLPGGGGTINGAVSIVLPTGLNLPVSLNLTVPVNDKLPISLNVPVNIKLQDTQLHDPFVQLENTLRPYVLLLSNLPDNWGGFWQMVGQTLTGNPPNLLQPNQASENPWPGFRTGLGTPVPTLPGAPTLPPISTVTGAGVGATAQGNPNLPPATLAPTATLVVAPGNVQPTTSVDTGSASGGPPATKPTSASDLGIITPVPQH